MLRSPIVEREFYLEVPGLTEEDLLKGKTEASEARLVEYWYHQAPPPDSAYNERLRRIWKALEAEEKLRVIESVRAGAAYLDAILQH